MEQITPQIPDAAAPGSPHAASPFLTTEELARRWHTTAAGLHNQVYRGLGIRSYRIGKRRLYRLADIVEFEESRRAGER